jgi:D-alanyl-D-alanine dipeptidase
MKRFLLVACMLVSVLYAEIPSQTRQLIVVTAKGWNDNSGLLQRYEKDVKGWHQIGKTVAVRLGRNGLGWGIGLHSIPQNATYIKHEGDGRSPAGIFELKQAFGYAPFAVNYPYRVYKETDHCVDDVHSRYYNKIVDSTKIIPDYHSMEHMKFPKDYYEYGIVVNHNHIDEPGAVPGAGSCIFLHIKKIPTAGCTVMNKVQIKEIITWLDAAKHPLLVQGTEKSVEQLLGKIQK